MSVALPHGWRMRNKDGEVNGPPPEDDAFFSGEEGDDISDREGLDIRPDSPGWEDVEDDSESLAIKCLICDATFPAAKPMVDHCEEVHGFDLMGVQKQHSLDFYSAIKLVNYIRLEVQSGVVKPDTSHSKLWSDEKYLQPALEDDALLFSLDDVIEFPVAAEEGEAQ